MIVQTTILCVAHQHCIIYRCHLNADTRQNFGVIFHILANFQNGGIFKHRFEHGQSRVVVHLPLCQSIGAKKIVRLPGAVRERQIGRFTGLNA